MSPQQTDDVSVCLLLFIQECFNSPYGTGFFSAYAERIPGESTQVLSEAAKENKVYLVGGRGHTAVHTIVQECLFVMIILPHAEAWESLYIFTTQFQCNHEFKMLHLSLNVC